jgi:hypothetical protein
MNEWWTYFIFLWLSVFTEGLLLPLLVGMVINSVVASERATAYAVSMILERLLGMTMGPILYGYVISLFPHYEIIDGKKINVSRAGM